MLKEKRGYLGELEMTTQIRTFMQIMSIFYIDIYRQYIHIHIYFQCFS